MPRVLVVDDSKLDRTLIEQVLVEQGGFDVATAEDANEAKPLIESDAPDVVLTDLVMPGESGLDLVRHVKQSHPALPVILMTSQGTDDTAVKALQAGAASYFPKAGLGPELVASIQKVLELARQERQEQELYGALTRKVCSFEIENRVALVQPLVKLLQRSMGQLGWCDETNCMQIGVALSEAIQNAVEHGNLELRSEEREKGLEEYAAEMDRRRTLPRYADRRVRVEAHFGPDEMRFHIEDDGSGFDPDSLPDPRQPANLEKISGRGVLLMRTFMDEVRFEAAGSRVVLVKQRRE